MSAEDELQEAYACRRRVWTSLIREQVANRTKIAREWLLERGIDPSDVREVAAIRGEMGL